MTETKQTCSKFKTEGIPTSLPTLATLRHQKTSLSTDQIKLKEYKKEKTSRKRECRRVRNPRRYYVKNGDFIFATRMEYVRGPRLHSSMSTQARRLKSIRKSNRDSLALPSSAGKTVVGFGRRRTGALSIPQTGRPAEKLRLNKTGRGYDDWVLSSRC